MTNTTLTSSHQDHITPAPIIEEETENDPETEIVTENIENVHDHEGKEELKQIEYDTEMDINSRSREKFKDWLINFGLGQYYSNFEEANKAKGSLPSDAQDIPWLDDETLQNEYGIKVISHRKRFVKAAKKYTQEIEEFDSTEVQYMFFQ